MSKIALLILAILAVYPLVGVPLFIYDHIKRRLQSWQDAHADPTRK